MVLLVKQASGPGEAHLLRLVPEFRDRRRGHRGGGRTSSPNPSARRADRPPDSTDQPGHLRQSYRNTIPLEDLLQTIDHAEVIRGLERGRARLGG